jgi:hypothetical protein
MSGRRTAFRARGDWRWTIDGDREDLTALLRGLLRALGLKSPTGISLTAKKGYSLRLPGPGRPKKRRRNDSHDDHGGPWRRVGHAGRAYVPIG